MKGKFCSKEENGGAEDDEQKPVRMRRMVVLTHFYKINGPPMVVFYTINYKNLSSESILAYREEIICKIFGDKIFKKFYSAEIMKLKYQPGDTQKLDNRKMWA